MPPERAAMTWKSASALVLAVSVVLCIHGAVPFLAIPTLAQALWSSGFSQSFANQSIYAIHAINFGAPAPAAIAFGLSGAYPAALLIKLGLHPADAYSAMVAGWLCIAFFGAWHLARRWGAGPATATAGALLWLTTPMVWAHAGYSMLAIGMALLPLYFWSALVLLHAPGKRTAHASGAFLFYVLCCLIAVFMDGYTFVMFAIGAGLLWLQHLISRREARRTLLLRVLPTLLCGLGLSYALYVAYVGRTQYPSMPIDVFRAWGADLAFFALPSKGTSWLFDLLGWSAARNEKNQFGDASVWTTTFCLPLLICALFAFWRNKNRMLSIGLLLVVLFGFYMALGPSLKIDSSKPGGFDLPWVMPPEYAVAPSGNAWLSEHLPGFTSMRAAYRWTALGMFGLWALLMLWVAQTRRSRFNGPVLVILAMVAINLPPIIPHWQDKVGMRLSFMGIDSGPVAKLRRSLVQDERVAFLPYSNDFVLNYLAAATGIRAYNIGGDKNLEVAKAQWPNGMRRFTLGQIDDEMPDGIAMLLLDDEADAVVLPYFDGMWSSQYFPCAREARQPVSVQARTAFLDLPPFDCPVEARQKLTGVRDALRRIPELELEDGELYATVRLAASGSGKLDRDALKAHYLYVAPYPIQTSAENPQVERLLREGWHTLEPRHVWSKKKARLELAKTPACRRGRCIATFRFAVFGANGKKPIEANFSVPGGNAAQAVAVMVSDAAEHEVSIPIGGQSTTQKFVIDIPDAQSPADVSKSDDRRTLGIALYSVDMKEQGQ